MGAKYGKIRAEHGGTGLWSQLLEKQRVRRSPSKTDSGRTHLKNKGPEGVPMAEVAEQLSSEHKVLSSNPNFSKIKTKGSKSEPSCAAGVI